MGPFAFLALISAALLSSSVPSNGLQEEMFVKKGVNFMAPLELYRNVRKNEGRTKALFVAHKILKRVQAQLAQEMLDGNYERSVEKLRNDVWNNALLRGIDHRERKPVEIKLNFKKVDGDGMINPETQQIIKKERRLKPQVTKGPNLMEFPKTPDAHYLEILAPKLGSKWHSLEYSTPQPIANLRLKKSSQQAKNIPSGQHLKKLTQIARQKMSPSSQSSDFYSSALDSSSGEITCSSLEENTLSSWLEEINECDSSESTDSYSSLSTRLYWRKLGKLKRQSSYFLSKSFEFRDSVPSSKSCTWTKLLNLTIDKQDGEGGLGNFLQQFKHDPFLQCFE